jgi:hypothetical protein
MLNAQRVTRNAERQMLKQPYLAFSIKHFAFRVFHFALSIAAQYWPVLHW